MDVEIKKSQKIEVTLSTVPIIDIQLSDFGSDIKKYEGSYEVTPTVDGSVLHTAKKVMEKDVNIKAIPFYEVSNQFDGETIYIAKEL